MNVCADKDQGGAIGTSLFLGIGSSLAKAGPLSLLLGFATSGLAVYGMVSLDIRFPSSMTVLTFQDGDSR